MNEQKQIAQHFDNLYQKGVMPWTQHPPEPALNKYLAFLKKQKNSAKILDIGCGNGWVAIKAAHHSFRIWGIDASSTTIGYATTRANEEKVSDKTHFMVGDGLTLPYHDHFFDALIDRGFFHHILPVNRPDYFANIERVLKKRSYIYLVVFSKQNPPSIGQTFDEDEINQLFKQFDIVEKFEDDPIRNSPAHLLHFIMKRKA